MSISGLFVPDILDNYASGKGISQRQIEFIVNGIVSGKVAKEQTGAFCMAVRLIGMDIENRTHLTLAMAKSGKQLSWADQKLSGPILDKHSSGGVGDKVSLMQAAIIAACGGYDPMISGRALGHTGGTLDKMDSIPGYRSKPNEAEIKRVVKAAGCAIVGATDDLAPADKVMYATRDVTGAVPSIDLITASILSKKMAAGLNALVMDVKYGSGAFMQDFKDATGLAQSIHHVANTGGLPCTTVLSDMNQVLGKNAGNALEVREAINYLKGNGPRDPRLEEVTTVLSAHLLVMGNLANDYEEAQQKIYEVIANGNAAECFARMVSELGGPRDLLESTDQHLGTTPEIVPIYVRQAGYLSQMNVKAIGYCIANTLGAGRTRPEDQIDYLTGLSDVAPLGTLLEPRGQSARPIAFVHARNLAQAQEAGDIILGAVTLTEASPQRTPVIKNILKPYP